MYHSFRHDDPQRPTERTPDLRRSPLLIKKKNNGSK